MPRASLRPSWASWPPRNPRRSSSVSPPRLPAIRPAPSRDSSHDVATLRRRGGGSAGRYGGATDRACPPSRLGSLTVDVALQRAPSQGPGEAQDGAPPLQQATQSTDQRRRSDALVLAGSDQLVPGQRPPHGAPHEPQAVTCADHAANVARQRVDMDPQRPLQHLRRVDLAVPDAARRVEVALLRRWSWRPGLRSSLTMVRHAQRNRRNSHKRE